jgi:hypothetical protein
MKFFLIAVSIFSLVLPLSAVPKAKTIDPKTTVNNSDADASKFQWDASLLIGYSLLKSVEGYDSYNISGSMPTINLTAHAYPFNNDILKNFGIGLGLGFYVLTTDDKKMGWLWTYPDENEGSLYWWPLYVSLKYKFSGNENFTPYLKIDYGYTFFDLDDVIMYPDDRYTDEESWWGGDYFGIGVGVLIMKNITFEIYYAGLSSGYGTSYQWGGIWTYWEEELSTGMLIVSVGITL